MKKTRLTLEPLETRYAPATLVNPFTVTYTQPDGNNIVVKINKPVFDQATIDNVFLFDPVGVNGDNSVSQELLRIDLTTLNAAGASLKIDNLSENNNANVGEIDASGLDLAAVVVDGVLQFITVGDADLTSPGLGLLQCFSLESVSPPSDVQGNLTSVRVRGGLRGFLDVHGSIATLKVGGLEGTVADDSAHVRAAGNITTIIAGSVFGDQGGQRSGVIEVGGDIGKAIVNGGFAGRANDSGQILSGGDIGQIRIGGNMRASAGAQDAGLNAARIFAAGSIGKAFFGRDVQGAEGDNGGSISAGIDIGSVKIAGDLQGGAGLDSGSITTQFGSIGSVKIGGSIVSGIGTRSGSIRAALQLASVKVANDLNGSGGVPIVISGFGQEPTGPNLDLAIGSIKVGGNVTNTNILAGFNTLGSPFNADAQIGLVKVGGNWTGSSLAAGIDLGADGFLSGDDGVINEAAADPNILARIGKVIIAGAADGTAAGGDSFGIVAQEVGFLSIDGVLINVNGNSQAGSVLGTTGDFFFQELV